MIFDELETNQPRSDMTGDDYRAGHFLGQTPGLATPPDAGNTPPSFWQKFTSPRVQGNPMSNPLSTALLGFASMIPESRQGAAAIHKMYGDQFEQNAVNERQALAREELEQRKKDRERDGLLQGIQALQNSAKIPAGNMRKMYLETLKKNYKALTGDDDTALIDFMGKANDEEAAAFMAGIEQFVQANPQLGIKDVSNLPKDPKAMMEILELGVKAAKQRADAAADAAFFGSPSGVPSGAVDETSPQPGTSSPVPAQTAPSGSTAPQTRYQTHPRQVQVHQMADQIGDQMQAAPEVRAMVKAALAVETRDFNSQAVSPKGARGIGQFMPATAQRFGVQDPTDDKQAIAGMYRYFDFLNKQFPGQPQLALAGYNAGEGAVQRAGNQVPNFPETQGYVQRGMPHFNRYLGGRPTSRAASNAPPEYQGRLAELNQEITRRGAEIQARGRFARTEGHQRIMTNLQRDYDNLVRERDKLEAQVQRVQDRSDRMDDREEAAKVRQEERSARLQESREHQTVANDNRLLTPEEIEQYEGTEPGWTHGMLRQALGTGKIKYQAKLPSERQKTLDGYETVYRTTGRLIERLEKPETFKALSPIIGTLLSNPQAWYERAVKGKVEGLTPEQQRFSASLALQMVQLRKELLGTAQSRGEEAAAQPFLASLDTATPETLLATLQAIQDNQYLNHSSVRDSAASLKQRVPPALPKPKGYDLADAGTPGTSTPASTTAPAAPSVSTAGKKARSILDGN